MRERREGLNISGKSDWRVRKRLALDGVSLEVNRPSSLTTGSEKEARTTSKDSINCLAVKFTVKPCLVRKSAQMMP